MNEEQVSVCVASYNNSAYVCETLDSIKNQTYKNIQIVIIDDCSTDNSVLKINDWIASNKVNCIFKQNEKNSGICKTFNNALKHCSGEYISIIGSDDILLSEKIDKQVALFNALDSSYGVVYSDAYNIKQNGEVWFSKFIQTYRRFIDIPQGEIYNDLIVGNFIPIMTVLWRKECFEECGLFDEELSYEDYDMLLRTSKKYKFVFLDYVSAQYRIHSNNFSGKSRSLFYLETDFKIMLKHIGVSTYSDEIIKGKMERLLHSMSELNSTELKHYFELYYSKFHDFSTMKFSLKYNINFKYISKALNIMEAIQK